jgi:hypothetical protein
MFLVAASVFFSALLLFASEPLTARFLLPTFGGTAGVWSTCLVFFQTLVLAGYTYAHVLRLRCSPMQQRVIHLLVLLVACAFLPAIPIPHLASPASPIWPLLLSLFKSVAVPFFALSATAPLLMEWQRQTRRIGALHRLYACSNAGSLLALVAYPALLEPNLTRITQARLWSLGMAVFLVLCALVAWKTWVTSGPAEAPERTQETGARVISMNRILWILLPACASGLLLAITNQLSQDVTPMPLLWVGPLAVYLLTFILCFESDRSYIRLRFIPASFVAVGGIAWLLDQGYLHGFWIQVSAYLLVLFILCMVCHGELYRLRPPAAELTRFYLFISVGGALGGIFVALVAPFMFKTLLETPILALLVLVIVTVGIWKENPILPLPISARLSANICLAAILILFGYLKWNGSGTSVEAGRNFYGSYKVQVISELVSGSPFFAGPARALLVGQTYHGLQFLDPDSARKPTTYYSEEEGLGIAFSLLPQNSSRKIGAIGLGVGTLAAYGRAGDEIRFYELNPDVEKVAREKFTYLKDSGAKIDVIVGDGRLSLEREQSQAFDMLVLDAFAGDAIPAHLLTTQAMESYVRHLKPNGLLAFHISNSHVNLRPVVAALAAKFRCEVVLIPPQGATAQEGKVGSVWMLASKRPGFLRRPELQPFVNLSFNAPGQRQILWTDDWYSLLPILQ